MSQSLASLPTTPSAVDSNVCSVVTTRVSTDPWPTIEAWVNTNRFAPREPQTETCKQFQRGIGFLTAPVRVQFELVGEQLTISAWLHIGILGRIGSLFVLPSRMHIRSGGFRAVVPRNSSRKSVNELLAQLGAPLIP